MSVTSSEVGERVLESTLTVLSPFLEGIGTYTCVAENVVDTANSTAEVAVFCESLPHSHCTSVLLTLATVVTYTCTVFYSNWLQVLLFPLLAQCLRR